jgi:ferric-dicitrate binding protein FerR (iron transport regulator)
MNPEPDEILTAEQQRARDAVRALRPPAADPAFRARLRNDFVSGRLAAGPARHARPAWYRSPRVAFALLPLAAAAAVAVVLVLNRGPAWSVAPSRGEGVAVVDGLPVPMEHTAELAARIRPGVRLRVPEGAEIELMSAGGVAIQVTAGSDFSVPDVPGRWFGRSTSAELRSGEVRITTGAGFHGARLAVITPEARVEITGTTLAVIREPAGTCVCVLEGRVMVGATPSEMVPVERGRRRYVFADGRPSEEAEMRPAEHEALPAFRDARRALFGESRGH